MDLGTMVRELGTGMLITTEIFVLTLVFSLPLGMVLAFGRMARLKVLSFLTKLYISIMRGTPLMLQLIVVYFAPYYVFGMKISKCFFNMIHFQINLTHCNIVPFLNFRLTAEIKLRSSNCLSGILEYPQYTRPEVWESKKVPDMRQQKY